LSKPLVSVSTRLQKVRTLAWARCGECQHQKTTNPASAPTTTRSPRVRDPIAVIRDRPHWSMADGVHQRSPARSTLGITQIIFGNCCVWLYVWMLEQR